MKMHAWAPLGVGMVMVAAFALGSTPARATDDPFALKDPTALVVGAGAWEAMRDNQRTYEFDATLRPNNMHLWIVKPQVGIVAAGDGDVLLYAGPLIDYEFTQHWVGTISTSVAYWTSGGYSLGSHIEFHSGAEFAYRFSNDVRLGVGFYHTSNADLTKRNPGSESILVEYSIPLKLGF